VTAVRRGIVPTVGPVTGPGGLSLVSRAPRAPGVSPGKTSATPQDARNRPHSWRVIAVGGGKGGIGKSLVSANLGIELASRGHKVVLVDADLGGANLHTCLGLEMPKVTLSDFVNHRIERMKDAIVPTGVPNLGLVSGALDALDVANPKYSQRLRLVRSFQSLEADYAILDLGAGTGSNVIDFFVIADHGILVLVPEPTCVENTYRFIKAAFFRRLANVQAAFGITQLVQEAVTQRQESGVKTPRDVIEAVKRKNPQAGVALEREMSRFRPRLVVNQARTASDKGVGDAVVGAWRRYFGLEMDYLGAIGYDDEVWMAVRKRRPVLLERPESVTARSLKAIATRLLELERVAEVGEGNASER